MLVALYPGLASLEELLALGALFACFFCAVGVLVLERRQPDLERGFEVPAFPVLPVLSMLATVWLGLNLDVETCRSSAVWMVLGLLLYLAYGRRHSVLSERPGAGVPRHSRHSR